MPDESAAAKATTEENKSVETKTYEAATADGEKKTGKDAPKFVVYLGGDPAPAPSGHPNHLWSESEWDARDDTVGYYRIDGDKVTQ